MRVLLLLLLAAISCQKPCALVCSNDADCPAGAQCYQHVACLETCISCSGICVDTFHNCGSCNAPCASGQVCSRGACGSACGAGLSNCNGSCYDLQRDRFSCGACNRVCKANEDCIGGACTAACN